jgi:hypothetical protein
MKKILSMLLSATFLLLANGAECLTMQTKNKIIQMTAQESVKKKLPKANIQVSIENTGFTPLKFPDEKTFLILAGPPGGINEIKILGFHYAIRDEKEFLNAIEKTIQTEKSKKMGKPDTLKIGNISHLAVPYILHTPPLSAGYCAVLYSPPANRQESVIVTFAIGIGNKATISCEDVIKEFKSITETLLIQYE